MARYGLDAPSLAVDDTVDGISCIMAVAQGTGRVARAMGVSATEGGTLTVAASAPLLLADPAETPRGDVSDQYHPLCAPALTLAHGNRTAGSWHLEGSALAPGEERAHDIEPRRSWPWSFKRGHDGAHQLVEPVRNPLDVVQHVMAPLDPVRRYGVVHGRRNDPEFLLAHPTILRSDSSPSHPIQRAPAVTTRSKLRDRERWLGYVSKTARFCSNSARVRRMLLLWPRNQGWKRRSQAIEYSHPDHRMIGMVLADPRLARQRVQVSPGPWGPPCFHSRAPRRHRE